VVDDFVITTGGVDIKSKQKFKEWLSAFMEKISDLRFEVLETFQKCRWKLRCIEVAYHGEEQRPARHPGRSEARFILGHGGLGRGRGRKALP
jgi:hypothetical protein